MDHVIKTMKGPENSHTGKEKIETVDIILANNEEGKLVNHHHSDDDNHDLSKAGSMEKIAEHVCGECHKTFRTISVSNKSISSKHQK